MRTRPYVHAIQPSPVARSTKRATVWREAFARSASIAWVSGTPEGSAKGSTRVASRCAGSNTGDPQQDRRETLLGAGNQKVGDHVQDRRLAIGRQQPEREVGAGKGGADALDLRQRDVQQQRRLVRLGEKRAVQSEQDRARAEPGPAAHDVPGDGKPVAADGRDHDAARDHAEYAARVALRVKDRRPARQGKLAARIEHGLGQVSIKLGEPPEPGQPLLHLAASQMLGRHPQTRRNPLRQIVTNGGVEPPPCR